MKSKLQVLAEIASDFIYAHIEMSTCTLPWICSPGADHTSIENAPKECKKCIKDNLLRLVKERTENES